MAYVNAIETWRMRSKKNDPDFWIEFIRSKRDSKSCWGPYFWQDINNMTDGEKWRVLVNELHTERMFQILANDDIDPRIHAELNDKVIVETTYGEYQGHSLMNALFETICGVYKINKV